MPDSGFRFRLHLGHYFKGGGGLALLYIALKVSLAHLARAFRWLNAINRREMKLFSFREKHVVRKQFFPISYRLIRSLADMPAN